MSLVMLLTCDGKSVRWPFCGPDESTTSLSYAQIKALRSPRAIDRIMAHEHLLKPQVAKLYGKNAGTMKRGVRLVRLAQRIRALDLVELCADFGEAFLYEVVTETRSPAEIRSELLSREPRPRVVVMLDSEADEQQEENDE